jgi:Holliday junction resolvase RusA-like endonuclease
VRQVKFSVPLKPMPSPRPRATRFGRVYMPAKYQKWKTDFAKCIPYSLKGPSNGFCSVFVECVVGIPPSYTKKQREAALGRAVYPVGDCDNYGKSVCDAMNGIVFADDRQVTALSVSKRYGLQDEVIVEVVFT